MTDFDFDVVINGGGPVGMALAIELGQRGVSTCVVERHATLQSIPKGQNLTQRTGEHMRAWGCADGFRSSAAAGRRHRWHDHVPDPAFRARA